MLFIVENHKNSATGYFDPSAKYCRSLENYNKVLESVMLTAQRKVRKLCYESGRLLQTKNSTSYYSSYGLNGENCRNHSGFCSLYQ